jgi:lipoprotein Spr
MSLFLRIFSFSILLVFLTSSCKSTAEFGDRSLRKPMTSSDYVYHKKETKRKYNTSESKRESKKIRSESIDSKSISYQQNLIIDEAESYKGTPYTYNGKNPKLGFDCSGYVSWVFNKAGYNLSGSAQSQSGVGKQISKNNIQAGDLVFFGDNASSISHVSIVIEVKKHDLYVIHATSSRGVAIDEINHSEYWGPKFLFATRVIEEKELASK